MNKKKVLLLSVATLSMFGYTVSASADTVVAANQTVQSNGQSSLLGELSVVQENHQVKAILSGLKGDVAKVTANLWSQDTTVLSQIVVFDKLQ